jgi:hypothetical protein
VTIETGLFDRLAGDAQLVALVETRIWPVKRPQNSGYPCVTYRRRDGGAEYGMFDCKVVYEPLWEFDCFGETYAAGRGAADRVKALLELFAGYMGGALVTSCLVAKEEEDEVNVNGVSVVRVRLWFRMTYQQ